MFAAGSVPLTVKTSIMSRHLFSLSRKDAKIPDTILLIQALPSCSVCRVAKVIMDWKPQECVSAHTFTGLSLQQDSAVNHNIMHSFYSFKFVAETKLKKRKYLHQPDKNYL